MITLRDIQNDARDTIQGKSYFAQEAVIADNGLQIHEIEKALDGRGFCVVVGLPVTGTKLDMDSDNVTHLSYATLPVFVQINPAQNASATGAQKEVLVAIEEVWAALKTYEDDDGTRFEAESTDFELVVDDAGLLAFVIWVRKLVVFTINSTA
jgi:hypothetical protein